MKCPHNFAVCLYLRRSALHACSWIKEKLRVFGYSTSSYSNYKNEDNVVEGWGCALSSRISWICLHLSSNRSSGNAWLHVELDIDQKMVKSWDKTHSRSIIPDYGRLSVRSRCHRGVSDRRMGKCKLLLKSKTDGFPSSLKNFLITLIVYQRDLKRVPLTR